MGGSCSQSSSGVNPFGIILIIVSITAAILLQSSYVFFFITSFQSLGLISLVEGDFTSSFDFILDSLQYFMVFSIMKRN
jgi:hypothetical protein